MSDRGGHSGEPSSAALEDLERRLRGLEVRVGRLEGQLGEAQRESFGEPAPALIDVPAAQLASALESPTSPIPIFGRALLGIAGAYFLRALTELGTLPLVAGVGLGIVYAAAWMGLAAKTPSNQRLEITVYSATSVLVLAPLIWEATVRFQALSTWVAAAVLAGFTILGQVVSWRKNVTVLVWIALLSGVFTAWVLLVATKDVLPFTLAPRRLALPGCAPAAAAEDRRLSSASAPPPPSLSPHRPPNRHAAAAAPRARRPRTPQPPPPGHPAGCASRPRLRLTAREARARLLRLRRFAPCESAAQRLHSSRAYADVSDRVDCELNAGCTSVPPGVTNQSNEFLATSFSPHRKRSERTFPIET